MAIQPNNRKRKHEAVGADAEEQQDDAEIAVPKKVSKASHTPKKNKKGAQDATEASNAVDEVPKEEASKEDAVRIEDAPVKKRKPRHKQRSPAEAAVTADDAKDEHMEEADISPDSGIEPEEQPQKFPNDFKMMHFRSKLQGNNFITELRHFLYMCKTRPKIVAKYIEKRGKPLELAEAFNRIDKTNVLHLGYLCEALQRIIMEILTNQKAHMESASHAGRYFLKSHGNLLEHLLSSAQPNHRMNALKLLTAIVCVEPQLGRQVLSSYDILSNVRTMEQMLSHNKRDADGTVRKAYIHFILAFLVDGNALLIRNILDRAHLIRVLAKGLIYDDHVTVCVVLNSLRQYVLENGSILKTKKVHVFDLECCKHFSRLYDWEGPQALVVKYANANRKETSGHSVDSTEREAVAAAVHQLLLVLLTSRKHGISFDAMSSYRQKHNKLQGKLLGNLYRPFADSRKIELILKTLQACPDLGRHTVRNFSNLVNPLRLSLADLPQAVDLLAQIIAAVPPSSLSLAMDKMTLTDFSYWIKELCLPIEALMHIVSKKMLKHHDFQVRLAVNRLLLAMMTQYSNYVQAIALREQSKRAGNSLRRFKFELLNHLLVNFPPIEGILYSLYMSIQEKDQAGVHVLKHLSVTLELVLIMCKENRAFVNKTSQILDYLDVLRPLYETNFDEPEDETQEQSQEPDQLNKLDKIKLELKSIKTILLLFPRSLNPQEQLFEKVLRSFIKAYMLDDVAVKTEAGELLHRLFHNTGIFDAASYEIDIWLEALIGFDAQTVDNVTSILLSILSLDLSQVQQPAPALNALETATNVANLRKLFNQIEQGQTVQAYVETLTLSKMMPLLLQGVELAPPYDAYVELVFMLLYHYHTKPNQVQQLYNTQLDKHTSYMNNWLKSTPSQLPTSIVKHWPQLAAVQHNVLEQPTQSFDQIFKADNPELNEHFQLQLEEGNTLQLHLSLRNPRRNMIYAHDLLFLLSQLVDTKQLNEKQSHLIADYLIRLLQIAMQLDGEQKTAIDLNNDEEQQQPEETHTQRLLHYIYGIRLSQLRGTQLLSETSETQLNYVIFLRRLTEHCRTLPKFGSYTSYYRLQLVVALEIALNGLDGGKEDVEQPAQLLECVALVDAFELCASECAQMLQLLTSKLQPKDYFEGSGKPNHYYELLLRLLRRLAALQEPLDCSQAMLQLQAYYGQFCELALAEQLEQLETALLEFLSKQYHHLAACETQFFSSFFSSSNRKLSKAAIRLACLLLQRNGQNLGDTFAQLLPAHLEQKELIYPLLDVAFKSGQQLEQTLLQRCYQSYKNGILKSIEKPQKAALIYKEQSEASASLIAQCMPKSECLDYCQKQLKFDAVELFQMRVLREIYWQAYVAGKDALQQANIFVNYINVNVQMLALDLKKQCVQQDKLEQLAYNCYDWWQLRRSAKNQDQAPLDWSRLLHAPHWLNFCRSCLKQAMHMAEEAQRTTEQDQLHGLLLKLMSFLCDQLYEDYTEEQQQEQPDAALLYEMICTHSCCYDHLLSESSLVKTHLLQLLETLARKAPAALHAAHIPVILGAYHARLTPADRYALALLEHYERFDVGLAQYRPFIWGESAVAHYALRASNEDEQQHAKLQQQDTNVAQVLALIVRQSCQYTIENFPIWRSLHAREQLPELHFANPRSKSYSFGDNPLEQRIEAGCVTFTQDVRRLCPKREELFERCYDPAFMVPLMMHCFAPESMVRAQWPVQNGLLALSFCALSSLEKDMRLAAACCQQRYRTHFELSKFYEKPLWTQAYDNIQAGLGDLRISWLAQRRTHGGTPRVPLIPALFIAHSFNVSTDPTHLLYKRLMTYLQLKQSFNFQTIPEFNVFFYSQEPEHQQYREFIVQLLSNGIKCSADLFMLVSTNTFKVLLSFYGSNLATLDTNLLLLSVLSTCVKIPGAVKIMLEHVGILPWLLGVIRDTQFHQFDIIEGIISILNNLCYALAASQSDLPDHAHVQLRLQRLTLQLLPLLSPRVSVPGLARLLNVLQKTAIWSANGQYLTLSDQQLDQLLDCIARHWPEQIASIRYLRTFGGTYASPRSEYCDHLRNEQQLDKHSVLALASLRDYVIDWWQAHNLKSNSAEQEQQVGKQLEDTLAT